MDPMDSRFSSGESHLRRNLDRYERTGWVNRVSPRLFEDQRKERMRCFSFVRDKRSDSVELERNRQQLHSALSRESMGWSTISNKSRLSLGQKSQSNQSSLRSNIVHVCSARRSQQWHINQRTLSSLRCPQVSEQRRSSLGLNASHRV